MEYHQSNRHSEIILDTAKNEYEVTKLVTKRKNSFVWSYFKAIEGSTKLYECIVCGGVVVGNQTSNLARHLDTAHNIIKHSKDSDTVFSGRGRPSRSLIWNYCTKEDAKHARCHLCDKLLYFGGGNTANISKHLRRKHPQLQVCMEPTAIETANSTDSSTKPTSANGEDARLERRERRGSSYVWNYCDKLSRHTVRCKLCNKVMSFHGTANVITHLQRKHNIAGKMENKQIGVLSNAINNTPEQIVSGEELVDSDKVSTSRYRAVNSTGVWKYCTRIDKDVVRCGICNKNLSFQGTSNLQRHLHRMHGVSTQTRLRDIEESTVPTNNVGNEFISQFCKLGADERMHCNMCTGVFDCHNTDEIIIHLTGLHAVKPKEERTTKRKRLDFNGQESSDDYDDFDNDSWSDHEETRNTSECYDSNGKKDEELYDDIIEEENERANCDEDPFDPNTLQDLPLANPLSPQSSRGVSPVMTQHIVHNNQKLQRLNEERMRMETEYFREKAGFYRMQKYLTALQAKKARIEIERLSNGDLNGAFSIEEMQPTIPTE